LAVAEFIVALGYRLKSRGFFSWWCHWDYTFTENLGQHLAGCYMALTQMSTIDTRRVHTACNHVTFFTDNLEILRNSDSRSLQVFCRSAQVSL